MEKLATSPCQITIVAEEARQCAHANESRILSPVAHLRVNATLEGTNARQYRCSRWQTGGTWRVRIRKQHTSLCKSIYVGRFRLRVSSHGADPGVQVINCDE